MVDRRGGGVRARNGHQPKKPRQPSKPKEKSGGTLIKFDPKQQAKLWLLEGWTTEKIVHELEQTTNLDEAAIQGLLNNLLDEFAAISNADMTVLRGWALEAARHLYGKMVEAGDYPNALKVVRIFLN